MLKDTKSAIIIKHMCVNYCQGIFWQVENVMNTDGHMTTHEGVALREPLWEILENILTF